jgi:hypothetical protein
MAASCVASVAPRLLPHDQARGRNPVAMERGGVFLWAAQWRGGPGTPVRKKRYLDGSGVAQLYVSSCKRGAAMKNGNAIAIYDIAAKHLQTAQVCVDRLHELGATHELKLLTGRLQRLALWATPTEQGQHKEETQIGRNLP